MPTYVCNRSSVMSRSALSSISGIFKIFLFSNDIDAYSLRQKYHPPLSIRNTLEVCNIVKQVANQQNKGDPILKFAAGGAQRLGAPTSKCLILTPNFYIIYAFFCIFYLSIPNKKSFRPVVYEMHGYSLEFLALNLFLIFLKQTAIEQFF